jgi:hypothetical protein
MDFEYPEDKNFFQSLLCDEGEDISLYESLFDFRPPIIKRREFAKKYKTILTQLLENYGKVCQLRYSEHCNIDEGFNIDHLIPISSNKLNKHMRELKALKGKKVITQSFGSNDLSNLVIACKKCNSFKKHKILTRYEIKRILATKNPKMVN